MNEHVKVLLSVGAFFFWTLWLGWMIAPGRSMRWQPANVVSGMLLAASLMAVWS